MSKRNTRETRARQKKTFPPVEDLLNQGAINGAVDELAASVVTLTRQYRRDQRANVAQGYYLASVMRENPDTWRDFSNRLDWNGIASRPKFDESEKAIEFVFRIACGLDSRSGRQKASKIKLALLDAWEARLPPGEIAGWLKQNGGIAGAAKKRHDRLSAAKNDQNAPLPGVADEKSDPVYHEEERASDPLPEGPLSKGPLPKGALPLAPLHTLVALTDADRLRLTKMGRHAKLWVQLRESDQGSATLEIVKFGRKVHYLRLTSD